jgi:hypothetical protein
MHIEPEIIASQSLPDRGYRARVRGQLKKYRKATGSGAINLAKACLALLRSKDLPLLGEFQDTRRLARTLDYWCQENGDIKDARVLHLVEALLRRTESHPNGQASPRTQIIGIGRGFAHFLAGRPTLPTLPAVAWSTDVATANMMGPGVFVATASARASTRPAPDHYFVVLDIGEPDFFVAQHFHCEWKSAQRPPVVRAFSVGFLFPQADPPRVLLRDPLTLENTILTPFVRTDAATEDQSQLLSYAWSLGQGADQGAPSADLFADMWTTTEWEPFRKTIDEIARHRMWEFGIASDRSRGAARGGVRDGEGTDSNLAGRTDLPGFVDKAFGAQFNSFTPLHRAAFEADVEAVATLLAQGWDPLRPDGIGRLAIDLAYASGNAEMVALLEPLTYPDGAAADE